MAETTLPPPDVSERLEKVHPSIVASALDVMEMRGEDMVTGDDGVRMICVRDNEPESAEKSEFARAEPVREKVMEEKVTLVAEQTKITSVSELTDLVTAVSLDG